jgi:glycosyltransferase involved in cell wall biosynthesis
MADLAVIILTHNEAVHIRRALRLVTSIAREIFVVDSFSSDDTVQIARAEGATVLQHKFINQSQQFQWALENAPISASWIMRLDADEEVYADLAEEIDVRLPTLGQDVVGIKLKRRHIFLGRWIRHGGRYPLILLRIWRRGHGKVEQRWMDEHVVVQGGRAVLFQGGFADHNLNDLTFFTEKHNKYATREALEHLILKYRLLPRTEALTAKSASRQAAAKRFIKERLYYRMPFWVAATGYFLYRYFLQQGFLDGREGLIYHFLQGFWYRFLVGAKVMEFEQAFNGANEPHAQLAALSRASGYELDVAPNMNS